MLIPAALAELKARLADLAMELRRHPPVHAATTAVTPRAYDGGDRVECYVDAELASGNGLGCWLEFWSEAGSWIIASSIRMNHDGGEDELVGLPRRYAIDDEELVAEVRGAASLLVEAVRGMDVSEL
jgi:hypothetical protein